MSRVVAYLQTSAITGGGLVVGFAMTGCSSTPAPLPVASTEGGWTPNAFLQVLPDNTIRFYTARSEMGQGVTTGLSTLVGEELDVNPLDMEIRLAGAHEDYVNPDFGMQGTGGSSSIHAHYLHLRQVGANTRALILEAASQDLGVSASSLSTDNGFALLHNEDNKGCQQEAVAKGDHGPNGEAKESLCGAGHLQVMKQYVVYV